eukprot:CAMPEP_0114246810 /NCGR_PEP_ID=MMETSP0058-20121206/12677_1 /TAXON_ID=36894 /ORGANISM="Pyramimonas parkeae, CCMP726" /LENGTH=539 /DNA_ID=CAMNT_0001360053 /DNA_START=147 /DNA_END=1766 /DNA_ORIENTATION=+
MSAISCHKPSTCCIHTPSSCYMLRGLVHNQKPARILARTARVSPRATAFEYDTNLSRMDCQNPANEIDTRSTNHISESRKERKPPDSKASLKLATSVQALVLGGGAAPEEHSMGPLTMHRAKPAIPFAGGYRLVDITLSNILHSGLAQIYVLTQFNSYSLNTYLQRAYPRNNMCRQSSFVEVLAANQTCASTDWTKGSADAVRHFYPNLPSDMVNEYQPDDLQDYLILSGEHLYRMDYSDLIRQHRKSGADITIATVGLGVSNPVLYGVDGTGVGLVEMNEDFRVLNFVEKPPSWQLELMHGKSFGSSPDKPFVASMGLYVFKKKVLEKMLAEPSNMDFGSDVIPFALQNGYHLQGYLFDGFWEDISTLQKFFDANLALAKKSPSFQLYTNAEDSTFTMPRMLPPSKLVGLCNIEESLISDGCWVNGSRIVRSVLGCCTMVNQGCDIEDTLIMGAEERQTCVSGSGKLDLSEEDPPVGIGANTVIRHAIIDRNARIGKNVRIVNESKVVNGGSVDQGYLIRSGIVVVLRSAVIVDGSVI